ncbi:hypothetical protein AWZ03_003590 [Drosophila navojoa]|uniref:C-type lectin domain-containing protein n=1 Tax=Drosophila navojoa TaxID=7232 RepID=A0A484BPU8_DRONA|nr:hypothetical protein AWZ03_003590 [Drosophila navojoa]
MIRSGRFLIALLVYLGVSCVDSTTLSVTCDGNPTQEYFNIGSKFYFVWHARVTWMEAAHVCRRMGGDLVVFESASELHQVSRYLISQGYQNAWLWTSGNALSSDHFTSLTTGMRLPFTEWAPGQPDNAGGNEKCVHLWVRNGSFKMNDWVCREKAKVLCQNQNHTRCWENDS